MTNSPNPTDARATCQHWLDDIDEQKARSEKLASIAAKLRGGKLNKEEAKRQVQEIDGVSPRVYDGAELAKAVRTLLDENERMRELLGKAAQSIEDIGDLIGIADSGKLREAARVISAKVRAALPPKGDAK